MIILIKIVNIAIIFFIGSINLILQIIAFYLINILIVSVKPLEIRIISIRDQITRESNASSDTNVIAIYTHFLFPFTNGTSIAERSTMAF